MHLLTGLVKVMNANSTYFKRLVSDPDVKLGVSSGMLFGVCWGLSYSVRIHLDPPVQAAGEHHPTDLKTAGVKSNAQQMLTLNCWLKSREGLKGDGVGGYSKV